MLKRIILAAAVSAVPSLALSQVFSTVDLAGGALNIGQGYDTVAAAPRGFCVERPVDGGGKPIESVQAFVDSEVSRESHPEQEKPKEGPTAQEVYYSLETITDYDYKRRYSYMSISAGGGFGGVFSAGGNHTESSETVRETYNFHVVLTIEVRNKVLPLPEFNLCDDCARTTYLDSLPKSENPEQGDDNQIQTERLSISPESPLVPNEVCGDSFIYAVATGGLMHLVATVDTRDQRSLEQAMTNVSASGSYGGFSASASASFFNMVETASEYASTTVRLYVQGKWIDANVVFGPDVEENEDAIKKLINTALKFPNDVMNEKAAWPYRGYLASYAVAGAPPLDTPTLHYQSTFSSELYRGARRYWNLKALVEAISASPSSYEFTKVKEADLPPKQKAYFQFWSRLVQRGGECERDVKSCNLTGLDDVSLFPTADLEGLPTPKFNKRLSFLCDIGDGDPNKQVAYFPELVPSEVGCLDWIQRKYWAGPLPNLNLSSAVEYCESLNTTGQLSWRLPTPEELFVLFASIEQVRPDEEGEKETVPAPEVDSPQAFNPLLAILNRPSAAFQTAGSQEQNIWASATNEAKETKHYLVNILKQTWPETADGHASTICVSEFGQPSSSEEAALTAE